MISSLSQRPVATFLYRKLQCIVLATATIAGCTTSFKQVELEKRYLSLEALRPIEISGPRGLNTAMFPAVSVGKGILQVRNFFISPSFPSRELLYRTGHETWLSDYYNLFLVAPNILIQQNVRHWIEASGIFRHVIETSSILKPDYDLEASIEALYGDFSRPRQAVAVMGIRFFLFKDVNGELTVALDKTYCRETPLAERSATALVQGYNAALASILTELEADLACSLTGSNGRLSRKSPPTVLSTVILQSSHYLMGNIRCSSLLTPRYHYLYRVGSG